MASTSSPSSSTSPATTASSSVTAATSPSPASSPCIQYAPRKTACASHLESLTREFVDLVNNRDPDSESVRHFAARMSSHSDVYHATSRDAHMAEHRRIMAANPSWHLRVVNVSVDVDEVKGKGKVWMTMEVTGCPPNLRKESVSVFDWEMRRNEWVCYRVRGMRGVAGYG